MIEQLTKPNVSSKHILMAAVVLIGIAAFYNWVIVPHTGYLMAAQKYESVAEKLAKKNQIVQKDMQRAKKDLSELQKKFKQFNTGLFDPNGADRFFGGIQNMADEVRCTVYSLNLTLPERSSKGGNAVGGIAARRAALSLAGSYKNIIKLMNKLQERPEQMRIDSVSIKPVDNNSGMLKCDMAVTVYVLRGSEEDHNG